MRHLKDMSYNVIYFKQWNPPKKSGCHRNMAMAHRPVFINSYSYSPLTRLFFNAAAWSPPWCGGTRKYDLITYNWLIIYFHGVLDASGLLRVQLNMQRAVLQPQNHRFKRWSLNCLKCFGISNKGIKTPGNCSSAAPEKSSMRQFQRE